MLITTFANGATSAAVLLASLIGSVSAQSANGTGYTVYSTFIYARTGERTPSLLPTNSSLRLTSYGAHQMYDMGTYFRGRYLGTGTTNSHTIVGLDYQTMHNEQVQILTPDTDYASKSAQAFFQSFYPPRTIQNTSGAAFDPLAVMASNTYLNWPSDGYQYPMVQTFTSYSPEVVWIDGTSNCLNAEISRDMYYNSNVYKTAYNETHAWYSALATLFQGLVDTTYWSYGLSFGVWEYLDFMVRHNSTINSYFSENGPMNGRLELFSKFSSDKLWNLYANTAVQGSYANDNILALGGKTLAAKVVATLQSSIQYGSINKLNFISGEFQPMYSLISMLGLADFSARFHTVPPFGSAIVFEVFSMEENPPATPDPSKLWVRFLFRNGSDPTSSDPDLHSPPLQAYPVFGNGPSNTDMTWTDFQLRMNEIAVTSLYSWCKTCQGGPLFCLPYMSSSSGSSRGGKGAGIAPAVGGVIGAFVTLAVAGLLVGALIFFGGLRFHRQAKSQLGGFKGSAKMASDADLHIPPNAAAIGVSIDNDRKGNHERVGSWELKSDDDKGTEIGHTRFTSMGSTIAPRSSFEDDVANGLHFPVTPRESV